MRLRISIRPHTKSLLRKRIIIKQNQPLLEPKFYTIIRPQDRIRQIESV